MFSLERGGYYAWLKRKPSKRQQANDVLDKKLLIFLTHTAAAMVVHV